MKSHPASLLRLLAVAATVSLLTLATAAKEQGSDRAADLLAHRGSIELKAFGNYVEVGTYAIQVAVKMGEPDGRLADGTWLYHHRRIADSNAEGTVVVRFEQGRVSDLKLVTPATAARLQAAPAPSGAERFARR